MSRIARVYTELWLRFGRRLLKHCGNRMPVRFAVVISALPGLRAAHPAIRNSS
jgi:hypothetical protein